MQQMNRFYRKAKFLLSAPDLDAMPLDRGFEVAFAGRSNAGKSSAINAIVDQNALARTSKTPGRTQQIVFFSLDDSRRLVDLPGYGYAKVAGPLRHQWQQALSKYLQQRHSLRGLVLLMDIRRPFTDFDRQMLDWCAATGLPVHVLLTKSDKLKRGPANATLLACAKEFSASYPACSIQLFSALKRDGIDRAHQVLDQWLELDTGS